MRSSKGFWLSIGSGIVLVLVGVLFLLETLGVMDLNWEVFAGPLFALGGLFFLVVFIKNTQDWWALIPAFLLIGIGTFLFIGHTMGIAVEQWAGTIFFGLLSLAFFLIYAFHHEHWWAIIPGGVFLTLSGMNLVSENELLSGGVFFLGLALTFGLIYILPKPSGKSTWALYPGGALLLIGALITLGAVNVINYVWPIALLVAGAYIIFRSIKKE
jgi:hypothetical protein